MPINKDTPTSEIIDDFVHSKNPKFKGKSKAERIKQAVAASYKVHGEEVEESNNTPYVKKSKTNPNAWDAMNKHGKVKTFGAEFKDAAMRHAGIAEETELDEARGSSYPLYHKSYTDAINHAIAHHKDLHVSDEDRMHHVGIMSKKPSEGNTTFVNLPATHRTNGKPHMIHIQVFNRGNRSSHPFELNTYSSGMGRLHKEETELDEARGRPKKDLGYTINPNNKEKLYHDNPEHMDRIRRLRKNGVLPPEQHAPSEHIINRLRQASTNQTGGQDIKYENGKTHHVSGSMASRTLDHYNGLSKPADKEAFQSKIRKSHEEHKSAIEEEVMSEETKAPLWGVSATNKFRTLDEETQLDEISSKTLRSYKIKNEADREKLAGAIGISKDGKTVGDKTKEKNKLDSRIRMDYLASKKTYPNIGWDKPAKVNATEENISESNEPKVTPYTAANRYHAVESAVRDIMSQNQNLKKIAEEETFRRNNPGLFKDK